MGLLLAVCVHGGLVWYMHMRSGRSSMTVRVRVAATAWPGGTAQEVEKLGTGKWRGDGDEAVINPFGF